MKNLFISLGAFAAAALIVSCSNIEPTESLSPDTNLVTITLKASTGLTKTAIAAEAEDNAYAVTWSEGDKIALLIGETSYVSSEAEIEGDGSTASFTIEVPESWTTGSEAATAVYPSTLTSAAVPSSPKANTTYLSATVEYGASEIEFSHIGAYLLLTLNDLDADATSLTSVSVKTTAEDESYKAVTVNTSDVVISNQSASFWAAVPACNYSAITIQAAVSDGSTTSYLTKTGTPNSAKTLAAGSVQKVSVSLSTSKTLSWGSDEWKTLTESNEYHSAYSTSTDITEDFSVDSNMKYVYGAGTVKAKVQKSNSVYYVSVGGAGSNEKGCYQFTVSESGTVYVGSNANSASRKVGIYQDSNKVYEAEVTTGTYTYHSVAITVEDDATSTISVCSTASGINFWEIAFVPAGETDAYIYYVDGEIASSDGSEDSEDEDDEEETSKVISSTEITAWGSDYWKKLSVTYSMGTSKFTADFNYDNLYYIHTNGSSSKECKLGNDSGTYYLSIGGAGSNTYACMQFTVNTSGKVYVYAKASSTGRSVVVYQDSSSTEKSLDTSLAYYCVDVTVSDNAETVISITAKGGGILIYEIAWVPEGATDEYAKYVATEEEEEEEDEDDDTEYETKTTTWDSTTWSNVNTYLTSLSDTSGNAYAPTSDKVTVDWTVDGLTYTNGGGSGIKIQSSSYGYLSLQGSGNATKCNLSFTATYAGSVTVTCRAGGDTETRTVSISDGSVLGTSETLGTSDYSTFSADVSAGKTIYIFSNQSSVHIQSIVYTYQAPVTSSDEDAEQEETEQEETE